LRDLILRPAGARLRRRLTALRDDGGRGAIGVLVAILIGAGVLFGMAALVIDVGQLYQNRAELQNGADAAALAVAKSCAQGTCPSSPVAGLSVATPYANANASKLTGGKANVTLVCGLNGNVSVGQGTCTAAVTNVCPPNPPTGANYVDVETSTLMPGGSTVLPPVFAGTLAGSHTGSTVFACAQAEWGAPLTGAMVGVTISACSWDTATGTLDPKTGLPTGKPPVFAPPPPYPPVPAASFDQTLFLKGGGGTTGCATEPAGAAAPGNFGWTADPTGDCTALITSGTYGGNTGNSVPANCKSLLQSWQQNKTVLEIPVYLKIGGTGNNAVYTLKGFAAFVITGYSLPSMNATDWVTGKLPCTGSNSCISGFFTHDLVDTAGTLGGVDLGADIIKLTG
jgi:Flp pilus assembly protein TadG